MPPLDGARLKVVRAQKHLQALKAEIASYLSTDPYEIPTEYDGDRLKTLPVIIKAGREPPQELSCIVGECVGALRASLDYIAWELACNHAAVAPVVGVDKGISFPIVDDPKSDSMKRFTKMAQKYSFPAAAVALIESVQPHIAGNELLGALNCLVNTDKHCLPLLTIAHAEARSVEITVFGKPLKETSLQLRPGSFTATGFNSGGIGIVDLSGMSLDDAGRAGAEAVKRMSTILNPRTPAPADITDAARSVEVRGQVTVFVAFDDGLAPPIPVDSTIENIVKFVANIIPRFDPFF